MPTMSSAASVHSTARRFGAYARTTNLPNESAIAAMQLLLSLPAGSWAKSHYTSRRQGLTLSSIVKHNGNAHALVEGIARHRGGHLVRRPVLSAAALRLSRGREGSDQHAAIRNHGAPPVRHHEHR